MCSNITETENTSHKSSMMCFILIFYQLIGEAFYAHTENVRAHLSAQMCVDAKQTASQTHVWQQRWDTTAKRAVRCKPDCYKELVNLLSLSISVHVCVCVCVCVCVAHLALPQTSVISVVITFHWENNSPGPVKLHVSTSSNKVTSISKKATELTIVKRKCELKYETCSVGVCDIYRLR